MASVNGEWATMSMEYTIKVVMAFWPNGKAMNVPEVCQFKNWKL